MASVVVRGCLFISGLAAWILALTMGILGKWRWALTSGAFALAADLAGRVWSRRSPIPFPASMSWFLFLIPGGLHTPKGLQRILEPSPGEHILEIGPGIGVHAMAVARALRPNGVLDVLDIQQGMLDRLMRRAARRGIANIAPRQGDAQHLPYPAGMFDAAYLIAVLGEVPDPIAALRELRRVLKPNGRLIVGEVLIDPDYISLQTLKDMGMATGFVLERRAGPRFAYWAVFRPRGAEIGTPTASELTAAAPARQTV